MNPSWARQESRIGREERRDNGRIGEGWEDSRERKERKVRRERRRGKREKVFERE